MGIPPLKFKGGRQPEAKIQDDVIDMLKLKEWTVFRTHGNKYQCGFPDCYAIHPLYKDRWIEIKTPGKISYTDYQLYYFPKIRRVWVLTDSTYDSYKKLWKEPNYCPVWTHNTLPRRKVPEIQDTEEGRRQFQIYTELEAKGYTVMQTYGNNIQRGLPDLLVLKGMKSWWVEVKRINSFTLAQKAYFPMMHACGIPIWVVYDDLNLLNQPANLKDFLP